MSKQKGKDKKQDNYDQLEKEYERQKRELLDATFNLRKVQERLDFLAQDNHRLERQRENQYLILTEKIEQLNIKNETNQKRLITMRNDLTNSEVENKKLVNSLNFLEKNMADQRADRNKEIEEMRKNHSFQVLKFQTQLNDYNTYMNQKDSREREIRDLYEAKQIQIANRIQAVADKERQKVQATDKIRNQMGSKIRQMRQNLLSLKKEQLQTTTRLTMLQNHQLTSQLEYQSKQTQKIVFKNEQLQNTITKLKQELEIHKQIQDQLAKRSHFSKGIIKKLHAKVQQLEGQLSRQKQSKDSSNAHISEESSVHEPIDKTDKQERMMSQAMQKQLQKWEKKYADLQSRYDSLKRQKEEVSLKWQTSQRTKNQLFNTLLKIFRDMLDSDESPPKENNNLSIQLQRLRQKSPQQWSLQERKAVLQIFLVTCQSYLTYPTLNTPQLRRIVIFDEQRDKQPKILLPKLSTEREKKMFVSSSEKKLLTEEDICLLAKRQLCQDKFSINIASKMVTNRLRDWGKQVPCRKRGQLNKKYQLSASYRS